MAQFDVCKLSAKDSAELFVADVQNAMFDALATRLVIPLYPLRAADKPLLRLNPVVEIDGVKYYLATQEMAAVRASALGARVTSLNTYRDQIITAIDFLTTGI